MTNLHATLLQSGPGVPLVFLHGFLGTAADWRAVCSHLTEHHCIGLDLPGHGKSPFMEEFVIDIPRFHLIGYSMGGRLAMSYAAKHPEQIASLTLLSAHPGLKTKNERAERLTHDQKWAKQLSEVPIDDFLKAWYDQSIFKPFGLKLTMRRQQNIPELVKALLHYSLAHQPRFEIDNVLVGVRDTKFCSLFETPTIIPNAGHAVHLENPEYVAKIIRERIRS